MLRYQQIYPRHLPYIQPPGAILFVTFRLAGSLPRDVQALLIEEAKLYKRELEQIADPIEQARLAYLGHKRLFGRWDDCLDTISDGVH